MAHRAVPWEFPGIEHLLQMSLNAFRAKEVSAAGTDAEFGGVAPTNLAHLVVLLPLPLHGECPFRPHFRFFVMHLIGHFRFFDSVHHFGTQLLVPWQRTVGLCNNKPPRRSKDVQKTFKRRSKDVQNNPVENISAHSLSNNNNNKRLTKPVPRHTQHFSIDAGALASSSLPVLPVLL